MSGLDWTICRLDGTVVDRCPSERVARRICGTRAGDPSPGPLALYGDGARNWVLEIRHRDVLVARYFHGRSLL